LCHSPPLSSSIFLLHTPPTRALYTLSLHDALPISAFLLNRLKLLTTYIPKTSAFTLAFSTSQRLRTTRASARTFFTFRHYITPSDRKSGSQGMPRPNTNALLSVNNKDQAVNTVHSV